MISDRTAPSSTTPPALRMTWASPRLMPSTFSTFNRASMHARTATFWNKIQNMQDQVNEKPVRTVCITVFAVLCGCAANVKWLDTSPDPAKFYDRFVQRVIATTFSTFGRASMRLSQKQLATLDQLRRLGRKGAIYSAGMCACMDTIKWSKSVEDPADGIKASWRDRVQKTSAFSYGWVHAYSMDARIPTFSRLVLLLELLRE